MAEAYRHGDWLATCDRCGREFYASQLRREWTGLMVCSGDWDPRHPQDFKRGVPDRQAVPWSRPEPPEVFVGPSGFNSGFDPGFH
jgi:hypothetical protein